MAIRFTGERRGRAAADETRDARERRVVVLCLRRHAWVPKSENSQEGMTDGKSGDDDPGSAPLPIGMSGNGRPGSSTCSAPLVDGHVESSDRSELAVGTRTLRTIAEANTTKSRTGNQRPADQEHSSVLYMGNKTNIEY